MRRLCIALALTACFHAHSVEKNGEEREQPQPKQTEGGAAAKPRQARRPQKPGRPPLAAAPGGLFVPGGVEQIQKALESRGYLDGREAKEGDVDAATSAAIRKFQSDQGIARTGNPDHETVRRLGLNPDSLFRKSAAVKENQQ